MNKAFPLFCLIVFYAVAARAGAGEGLMVEVDPAAWDFPAEWIAIGESLPVFDRPAAAGEASETAFEFGAAVRVHERVVNAADNTAWLRIADGETTGWSPAALLAPPAAAIDEQDLKRIGAEPVDRWRGISPDYVPPDLVAIDHGYQEDRAYRLRAEAAEALDRLVVAARLQGVRLKVVSAYRSYHLQRDLYLNKLARSGWNQTTVARPGHSEHQLGTAVDFTDGNPETLLRESFGETEAGRWLRDHAPDFGFAVSYTEANRGQTGYSPEPWHYRYWGVDRAWTRHRRALGTE